mmetsp:Transcript_29694/g.75218  ORF Transcript_29694/g.75218 Transcript_29694/m.75218 type:complete len:212 (-) Transcript_29694:82-717(-)
MRARSEHLLDLGHARDTPRYHVAAVLSPLLGAVGDAGGGCVQGGAQRLPRGEPPVEDGDAVMTEGPEHLPCASGAELPLAVVDNNVGGAGDAQALAVGGEVGRSGHHVGKVAGLIRDDVNVKEEGRGDPLGLKFLVSVPRCHLGQQVPRAVENLARGEVVPQPLGRDERREGGHGGSRGPSPADSEGGCRRLRERGECGGGGRHEQGAGAE